MQYFLQHWFGFAIIGASLAVVAAFLVYRHLQWVNKICPTRLQLRGVGIHYMSGVVCEGAPEAIAAILDATEEDALASKKKDELKRLWIEVYPWDSVLKGPFCSTGFVDEKGRPARPPAAYDSKISRVTGTVRAESKFPWTKMHYVLMVRLRPRGATSEDNFWGRSEGKPSVSLGETALFHEYAQHVVPFVLKGTWNTGHTDARSKELEERIKTRYRALTSPPIAGVET